MRAARPAKVAVAPVRLPAAPSTHALKHGGAVEHRYCAAGARRRQAHSSSATGGACRQRRQLTVAAAVSRDQSALLEQPALVLAGFYIEELATVRQLLDQVGGQAVRVVPSTPALLHAPLAEALAQPEPAWDQPVPPGWQQGGGWGQQKMAVMAGLSEEQCQMLLNLFEEVELGLVVPALAAPDNLAAPLGGVLAVALKAWRARPAPSGGRGSREGGTPATAAPLAANSAVEPAAGAAAGAAGAPSEAALPFVAELPPVEAVLPEEVWQPEEAQHGGRQTAGAEVVQAEFTEAAPAGRPAQQGQQASAAAAAGPPQQPAEEVPLDLIDAIAAGVEPAGAGAVSEEEAAELAAAAEAMGLGSAQLQQLVDGVAAKAAEAMHVPFVADPGRGGAGGARAQPEAPRSSTGTRKPWETGGSAAADGSMAASSSTGSPSRGFGAAAGSAGARKDARRGARGSGSALQERLAELKTAGAAKPGAATSTCATAASAGASSLSSAGSGGSSSGSNASLRERLAELKAAPKAEPPSPASAASAADAVSAAGQGAQRGAAGPGVEPSAAGAGSDAAPPAASAPDDSSRTIPPPDAFVLSKAQLRGVADRHGLDFDEMLAGLAERGISLAE